MIELRQYQKEIIPKGIAVLKRYYMVWLTGQERAGKTLPALGILNDGGFTNALCITTLNAANGISKANKELAGKCNLDIINYESCHKYLPFKNKYQVIWLDESHKLGQAPKKAVRLETVRKLCQNKYIIYSTATPSAEGFYKLYHQLWVSSASPLAQWPNFYAFAKDFINVTIQKARGRDIRVYKDVKEDKLWPLIGHLFITWTRKDAGFTVEPEDHLLTVKMSDHTIAIYNQLKKNKIYINENGDTSTINGGAELISKLNQVGSGTLIFDANEGEPEPGAILDYSKAEFIKSYFAGQKIAIFYKYIAEGKLLRQYFQNHTDDASLFNSRNDLVFIGQVKSYCEGVDLSTADCLVNYNIEFSATVYSQSRSRHLFKEREKPAPVYFIFPEHGIDHKIYQAVSNKINFTWSYYSGQHVGKQNTDSTKETTAKERLAQSVEVSNS